MADKLQHAMQTADKLTTNKSLYSLNISQTRNYNFTGEKNIKN